MHLASGSGLNFKNILEYADKIINEITTQINAEKSQPFVSSYMLKNGSTLVIESTADKLRLHQIIPLAKDSVGGYEVSTIYQVFEETGKPVEVSYETAVLGAKSHVVSAESEEAALENHKTILSAIRNPDLVERVLVNLRN